MSAWDDPITHIRELEARLSRVRVLADEWSGPESHRSGAWLRERDAADRIRAELEGR